MQKKIWISAFDLAPETVQGVIGKLQTFGLAADGHFFSDNLEKMAWTAPRKQLLEKDVAIWLLLCSAKSLKKESLRYGISMLALSLQAVRGANFPIVILQADDENIDSATLPTPLANAKILPLAGVYGAKLVAMAHTPLQTKNLEYRLDVYGIANVGQWFEIGPPNNDWQGAIFGVSDGEITLHAVGSAGQLPEKSILNYPQQGLEITVGADTFTAWAVQNELDSDSSYYLKVEGTPGKILFCPYSSAEETEAYIISLL